MYVHNTHAALARKRIVKAFRSAKAVAPEHAQTLQRLGLKDSPFMRRLLDQQIVREVRADEFYLDEDALREYESTLFKWLAVPLALILILMVYAITKGFH